MNVADAVNSIERYATNRITGRPLYVCIEPTVRCNADCRFCDYRRSNANAREIGELGSYLPIISFLNPIAVSFAGGEPLLRTGLEALVQETKSAKVPFVEITTNGSTLTLERYCSLSEAGADRINISLDFPDERHDESRKIPGLYSKIMEFLKDAKKEKRGAKIGLNTIYMKENIDALPGMLQLAAEYHLTINLMPYIRTSAYDTHAMTLDEKKKAAITLRQLMGRFGPMFAGSTSYMDSLKKYLENGKVGRCDAGRSFMWVLPDGRMTACNRHEDWTVNLMTQKDAALAAIRSVKKTNDCQRCYSNCRGEPESATSKNPFKLARMAFDFAGKIRKG